VAARTGEIAALARDMLDLADALSLPRFHVVGHDWAPAPYALAALAPQRLLSLTTLAVAYGTNVATQQLDVQQLRAYWYQWYLATPRGADALRSDRVAFCRDLWRMWSPGWAFDEAEYAATAASFDNPDFVRWGFVPGAAAFAADRAVLDATPLLDVPTVVLMGRDDGATLPNGATGKERLFASSYALHVVPDCGHFVQREQPAAVTAAVREALHRDAGAARRQR